MRCLVVDDSRELCAVLKLTLKSREHVVLEAFDGEEAWTILQEEQVDIVISDWVMPRLDGLGLCKRIRAEEVDDYTYFIMLTSITENLDIISALEAGADDFLSKPVELENLQARVHSASRILNLQKSLKEKNQALKLAYDNVQSELKIAAEMQRNLLPKGDIKPNSNLTIKWLFHPSQLVGGDIFNYLYLDNEHVAFYSLDVAGHGVAAAMLSVSLHKVLSSEFCLHSDAIMKTTPEITDHIVDPSIVMRRLNTQFLMDVDSHQYFTMIYGVLNIRTGKLMYCQAAHPHPILISSEGKARSLGEGGFPVGLVETSIYDTLSVDLVSGDRLILHSDGITECTNLSNEPLGEQRLMDFFVQHHDVSMQELMFDLHNYLLEWRGGKYEFTDDISLVAFEFNEPC